MNLTQYLIFEIGTECNLGTIHAKCPNQHPDRYKYLPTDTPITDDQIVAIAASMYAEHGFRGRIGWHYYNEPLMRAGRMWRLMDRIDAAVPEAFEASYTLWTNGTLLPEDCSQFARFDEIHVTNYNLPDHPACNITALVDAQPKTQIYRGSLDDRLHAIGNEPRYNPCYRMFTEFIIDYYGNVHLCCYDWRGIGSRRSVHTWNLDRIVKAWQKSRRMVARVPLPTGTPLQSTVLSGACDFCKMQSKHIPKFIPEIVRDARRYLTAEVTTPCQP